MKLIIVHKTIMFRNVLNAFYTIIYKTIIPLFEVNNFI